MAANVSYEVLGNISSTARVSTFNSDNGDYAFVAIPPSQELAQRDYTALTFGFWCSAAFSGNLQASHSNWQMVHFVDPALTDINITQVKNPYYLGWAGLLTTLQGVIDDPEIVDPVHGGMAFVMACNATLYNIEYDYVNGTVVRFVAQMTNSTVVEAAIGPMANDFAQPYLQQYAESAVFSNTSAELADKLSLSYSKAALSFFAQTINAVPATRAQERTSVLVARIEVAPLYALVVADLLYVVAGIGLMIAPLKMSSADVRQLQSRLGITALVADRFETEHELRPVKEVEDLFEECKGLRSRRIGIVRSEEHGWSYAVTTPEPEKNDGSDMELSLISPTPLAENRDGSSFRWDGASQRG
ncbi:hypothetical protein LTR78_009012 [Recurvomyces mirabilis]|uniref:Uncharacterized protein n=1 Tax=Recurvomyces mirabilis TaxID=574656 RepID=A0AAE0TSC7_9PEZI|nr:hypothetical protein LTR78_009012 [Recurvomyces mirabilis]